MACNPEDPIDRANGCKEHSKEEFLEWLGPLDFVWYFNSQRFNTLVFGDDFIISESVITNVQFDTNTASWIDARVNLYGVDDETRWL